MKFRFGYGITGNQEIGNYNFASTYNTGVYSFGGTTVNALSTVTMANPNIHWEEVRQTNLGFDLSMLNRRVYFAVDAYIKNTCDMLVKAAIPITSGFEDTTTTFTNAGKVQNKGVEMTLNTVNFNDEFKWETSVTATYNKNKIVDLNSNTPLYQNQYNNSYLTIQKVGAPINAFYGYVTGGIFQTSDEVAKHAVQVQGGTAAGDIKFNDLNNDGVINENDRTIIGNPNPDWIFSMSTSAINSVITSLKRYHINGLQFYDWQYKHHKPLAGTPDKPDNNWTDIANRNTSLTTVKNYISAAHKAGMLNSVKISRYIYSAQKWCSCYKSPFNGIG